MHPYNLHLSLATEEAKAASLWTHFERQSNEKDWAKGNSFKTYIARVFNKNVARMLPAELLSCPKPSHFYSLSLQVQLKTHLLQP